MRDRGGRVHLPSPEIAHEASHVRDLLLALGNEHGPLPATRDAEFASAEVAQLELVGRAVHVEGRALSDAPPSLTRPVIAVDVLHAAARNALEVLARESVDVAIVDMRLPGADGNLLIMKAYEIRPSLKFVIYNGSASYRLPQALAETGIAADDVFQKPLVDMDALVEHIERIVQERG